VIETGLSPASGEDDKANEGIAFTVGDPQRGT